MPNGKEEFRDDIEFRGLIKQKDDRGLLELVAEKTYDLCGIVASHETRLGSLEGHGKRTYGFVGIVGAFVGGAIAGIVDFFITRVSK